MTAFFQRLPLNATLASTAAAKAMDAIAQIGVALPGSVVAVNPQNANTPVSLGNAIVQVQFDPNLGFNLPNVVIPVYGAEYLRQPIQKGDLGVALPCRLRIDGTTSMWRKKNDNVNPSGNLQSLIWMPIGNAQWNTVWVEANAKPSPASGGTAPATTDLNKVNLYGKQGVVAFDWDGTNSHYYIELDATNGITVSNQAKETVLTFKNDDVKLVVGSNVSIEATNGVITIEYGANNVITVNSSQIELQVSSTNLIMTSSGITINGNVNITGAVVATGNVTGQGTSLHTHIHSGVQTGAGNTGPPV